MGTEWIEHCRTDDGELLGFIAPSEQGYKALTVFGYQLATVSTRTEAASELDRVGLEYLTDRWIYHSPDLGPIQVGIVEASPTRVVVASNDYGASVDIGVRFTLDAPTGDILTPG